MSVKIVQQPHMVVPCQNCEILALPPLLEALNGWILVFRSCLKLNIPFMYTDKANGTYQQLSSCL